VDRGLRLRGPRGSGGRLTSRPLNTTK